MSIIVDTGPLVAFLDKSDHHNYNVGKAFAELEPPIFTTEGVITETLFLLQRGSINPNWLFEIVVQGDIIIKPVLTERQGIEKIRELIQTYSNVPASFADASLIYLYENLNNASLFTLDSDFAVYRTSGGKLIQTVLPL